MWDPERDFARFPACFFTSIHVGRESTRGNVRAGGKGPIPGSCARWRPNLFSILLGAVGKKFIAEATRLVRAVAEGSALESVALSALTIMPRLLLQQPPSSSSHRQHTDCLQRHLVAWQSGNIQDLLLEGHILQNDLIRCARRKRSTAEEEASLSRSFSRFTAQRKVKVALRLLSSQSKGKVLNPDDIASGVESAEAQPKTVHAMTELFNNEHVKGLRLVDAHNSFNSVNWAVMLKNIQVTCQSLAVPDINMYRSDAELFAGEETIFSREGTT